MTLDRQVVVKKTIEQYKSIYQREKSPIPVNFRELVPELKKAERFTHLIHSYPAKLLTNIPYFFLASDALCPANGVVLDPFCGSSTTGIAAAKLNRRYIGIDNEKEYLDLSIRRYQEIKED